MARRLDVGDGSVRTDTGPPRACQGFSVPDHLPSLFARDGGGELLIVDIEELEVPTGRPLMTWAERHDAAPFARLHSLESGGYRLSIDSVGCFEIDPAARRIVIPRENDARVEARLWGLPAALCFIERGDLPVHAAAVDIDGSAALVAAPGRHGKTTLASALLGSGYRVLSEDLSCCSTREGGADVVPGPTLLRVRRDTFMRLSFPDGEVIAEDPDRVYVRMMGWARGSCEPIPLRAIILLREDEHDVWWESVEKPDAIRDLWALSFRLPDLDSHVASFRGVSHLGNEIPVWNLHRPMRYSSLQDTVDAVVKLAGS